MHGVEFILVLLPLMIQKLGSMAFAYSFSHTQLKTNEHCCIFRAKQRNLKSRRLFTAIASFPYFCLHISWAANREYWFDNQDILKLVIISSIFLTLMFDSGVTLWGEIRWSHSSKVRERFCAVCWCSSWLVPLSTRVGQTKDCLRLLSYRSVFLWLFFFMSEYPLEGLTSTDKAAIGISVGLTLFFVISIAILMKRGSKQIKKSVRRQRARTLSQSSSSQVSEE